MRGLFKPSSYFLAQSPHSSHSLQYRAKQSVRGSLVLSVSMNSLGAEWRLSDCQRWSCCHSTKSNELDAPLQIYLHDCWLSLLTLFTFAGGRVHPWRPWGEGKSLGACLTRAGGGVYPGPGCSSVPQLQRCQGRIFFRVVRQIYAPHEQLRKCASQKSATPVSCGCARWPPNSRYRIISISRTPTPLLLLVVMVSGNG